MPQKKEVKYMSVIEIIKYNYFNYCAVTIPGTNKDPIRLQNRNQKHSTFGQLSQSVLTTIQGHLDMLKLEYFAFFLHCDW